MNLTLDEVKEVIKNQSARKDGVKTLQLLLAEDLLKLYEKLEELINDWNARPLEEALQYELDQANRTIQYYREQIGGKR